MSTNATTKHQTLDDEQIAKAMAAAAQFSAATTDLIEASRDGFIPPFYTSDTATNAADGLRLLLEATDAPEDPDEAITQLYGALIRYLEGDQ